MIPADLFTLDTLLRVGLWGGGSAMLGLIAYACRDRDYLWWRWQCRTDGGLEPYPEPEGYVADIVTPQERAKLPQQIATFAAAGSLFPLLETLGEPVASFALPLAVAMLAIGAALISDDAEDVGAPAAERPSRWQRIKPHLVTLALFAVMLFAADNPKLVAPLWGFAEDIPAAPVMTVVFLVMLGVAAWRWHKGVPAGLDAEGEISYAEWTIALLAFACSIGIIALLAWVM